jgi:hypothetical protein
MAKLLKKKVLFFLLTCNLFTQFANAQYYEPSRLFYGGLIGGFNFSQVDGDNFAGYHKAGFNVGGVLFMKLAEQFAPSIEFSYAQKGSRTGNNQSALANDKQTTLLKYRINLNYAEMPILLNYFEERKTNFGAGFALGYLIGSKENYTTNTGITYEQDAKLYPFKKLDMNFVLNGNAHIWEGFFINLRFNYSLFSIRNNGNSLTGRSEQFNNVWTTRILYMF